MYLNQLESFVCVVNHKSFTLAAKELFLSQPSISAHIKALEAELGVQLLVRSTKGIMVSEAGNLFYSYAVKMMEMKKSVVDKIQDLTHEIKGALKIAASTVPAQYVLPRLLADISSTYPQIFYRIAQLDSREVIDNITNFEAEIGIGSYKLDNGSCHFIPFYDDKLTIITPNTEKYRSLGSTFPLEQIKNERYISREENSGTQDSISAFLEKNEIDYSEINFAAQFQSTEGIKKAVHAGLGISIISRLAAQDYVDFEYLLSFPIDEGQLSRKLYLIYHKNRFLSPAAQFFVQRLKEVYPYENESET